MFLLGKIAHRLAHSLSRCAKLIFMGGDTRCHPSWRKFFLVNVLFFQNHFNQRLLIGIVVNNKVGVIADVIDFIAQNPHTGGVEGAGPDFLPVLAYQCHNTFPHFLCRFIGKGDGQNIPWRHPFFINQIGNACCQYPCFPRTGTGQYQKRPLGTFHRLPLRHIQLR